MPEINPQDPFVQEVFEYLTELRDSGETNMMGAGDYLQRRYGFARDVSRKFLFAWMESLKE